MASPTRATLLGHPEPTTALALFTDASDTAIGAALQQRVCDAWQPLTFCSHKRSPTQQKYSPYDPKLLAVHEAIKYFRNMVEGLHFVIFTDHKPHPCAFQQRRDKCSPRQFCHLEFIGQFSTDFRNVSGQDNVVADALSKANSVTAPLDYPALANPRIRIRSYKTFCKMVPDFDWNQGTFPGRTSISTATRLIHNRGHL